VGLLWAGAWALGAWGGLSGTQKFKSAGGGGGPGGARAGLFSKTWGKVRPAGSSFPGKFFGGGGGGGGAFGKGGGGAVDLRGGDGGKNKTEGFFVSQSGTGK